MIETTNRATYEKSKIVNLYLAYSGKLQKPELVILHQIADKIRNKRMLDIGVGGGRTTPYFCYLVKEYVAIDYSENMISACRIEYPHIKNCFRVGDAASMKEFKNNSFDFVLASFNTIDYAAEENRKKILNEINRVLKEDGIFVFSSHNVRNIEVLMKMRFTVNLKNLLYNTAQYALLRFYNRGIKTKNLGDRAMINDGALYFGLKTHYIKPEYQIEQLKNHKFKNIRIFSLDEGNEITGKNFKDVKDSWLYYMCTKSK